jgi:hypothetical protein
MTHEQQKQIKRETATKILAGLVVKNYDPYLAPVYAKQAIDLADELIKQLELRTP